MSGLLIALGLSLLLTPTPSPDQARVELAVDMELGLFDAGKTSETMFEATDLVLAGNRVYVVDQQAQAVFAWDLKSQRFHGQFGVIGDGPGELRDPQIIAANSTRLFIFNQGNFRFQYFKLDGSYIRKANIALPSRPINIFLAESSNQLLISSQLVGVPKFQINLYNEKGKPLRTLKTYDDKSVKITGKEKMQLTAYGQQLVTAMLPDGTIAAGLSGRPYLEIMDLKGKVKHTVSFQIPRRLVSDEDIEEFKQQSWYLKASQHIQFQLDFAELHPFYSEFFAFEDGFILIDQTPVSHRIRGYVLNKAGVVLQTFHFDAGESGLFKVSGSQLFWVYEDEQSESFGLRRLRLPAR